MRKILLDMQSGLFAKAIQRTLSQELDDYQVIISEHPDKTVQRCKTFKPYALLMEATGYTPWSGSPYGTRSRKLTPTVKSSF